MIEIIVPTSIIFTITLVCWLLYAEHRRSHSEKLVLNDKAKNLGPYRTTEKLVEVPPRIEEKPKAKEKKKQRRLVYCGQCRYFRPRVGTYDECHAPQNMKPSYKEPVPSDIAQNINGNNDCQWYKADISMF